MSGNYDIKSLLILTLLVILNISREIDEKKHLKYFL